MRVEDFAAKYPRLHHLAYGPEIWPSLQQHGLLSTHALARLWDVSEHRLHALTRQHRPETIVLRHPRWGEAFVRDQHPLNMKMLARALTDVTPEDWLATLNSLVFFTPDMNRLERLYAAYAERPRLVLTVDTRSLLAVHLADVVVSRLNTGAVRHVAHARGSDTFVPVREWPGKDKPAEVAVRHAVPDLTAHLVSADVWKPDGSRRPI